MTEITEKEIEAAIKAFQMAHTAKVDIPLEQSMRDVLEAAARVRAEANAGELVAWPKIMYVCENCLECNPEMCGHDRRDIYVTPDGRWLCDSCIDGEGTSSRDCTTPPMLYAHPAPQPSGPVKALADALRGLLKAYENAFDWSAELPPETVEAERIANEVLHALTAGKPEQEGAALNKESQNDE